MGNINSPQALGGQDISNLMDMDEEQRFNMMQQMGVRNILPPLPHSPCLRNRKTGVVLPWEALLAAQHDLMECCDEFGNTDPAIWKPKVITQEKVSQDELRIRAQQQVMLQAFENKKFARPSGDNDKINEGPSEYEKLGVISFADVHKLRDDLKQD